MSFWQFSFRQMLLLVALAALIVWILRLMYLSDNLPFLSCYD